MKTTLVAILILTHILFPAYAQDQFNYSAADVADHLVVITCESDGVIKSGCGFVAMMNEKPYLLISQHIILGADKISFTSPTGRIIKPRSVELSNSRDIARLALAEEDGLALADHHPMGAPIAVFGSNQSQKEETALYGTITGVGADIVEISAEFNEGNGGAAVLNANQEVIGIASHVTESYNHAMKKGTQFENKTRRFCYRLDRIQWKRVNWKQYNKKYGAIYFEGKAASDQIIRTLNRWADAPAGQLRSKNTEQMAGSCRSQARRIRMMTEQRDLTEYLIEELEMQALTLEAAAKIIDRYGATFR